VPQDLAPDNKTFSGPDTLFSPFQISLSCSDQNFQLLQPLYVLLKFF